MYPPAGLPKDVGTGHRFEFLWNFLTERDPARSWKLRSFQAVIAASQMIEPTFRCTRHRLSSIIRYHISRPGCKIPGGESNRAGQLFVLVPSRGGSSTNDVSARNALTCGSDDIA